MSRSRQRPILSAAQVAAIERLRDAISEHDLSRRQLAVWMAGDEVTPKRITNAKTMLVKWLNYHHSIRDDSAERLSAAFRRGGYSYDRDYFKAEAPSRGGYHTEVQRLSAELDELRQREDARHEELLQELQKLREA